MSAKRKHRSTNEYLKYLKGELSPKERYAFERDLEADPFEKEAMEGLEQYSLTDTEEDLLSLHASLHDRLKRKRRRRIYSLAAAVASILIVGTVFLNIYEINPETASESIPKDESFLHEEATGQSETPMQVEKSEDRIATHEEDDRAEPSGKGQVQEGAQVQEVAQDQQRAEVQEEALDLDISPVMEQVDVREEEEGQMKALVREENPAPDHAMIIEENARVPAPVAGELVAVEAQAKRSRKKESIPEAAAPYAVNRVTGIVVSSEDQEPLPGASILVKGSDSGMVTDLDGRFSLVADQQEQTTVIASYIGMETGEYQLAGGQENLLVMQPDVTSLDEVVVVGYAAEKESYATGAVQGIKLDKEAINYSVAEPEGGLEAFKVYMEQHIRFPAGDTISDRKIVVLKFKVLKDGTISEIQTLRSPGEAFTEEAIRLLHEGPAWKPARSESGVMDDDVRIRIIFKRQ